MIPASRLVDLARLHIGERYVLGARVPLDLATATGPWDCAELASWLVYQTSNLVWGCVQHNVLPSRAEPYTGGWAKEIQRAPSVRCSVDAAIWTPGAFLLRRPREGVGGHIALSTGDGRTIEAHSTKLGVIAGTATGRRWDDGVLVPGYDYQRQDPLITEVLRLGGPPMTVELVREVQGVVGVSQDGVYGPKTAAALVQWQAAHGLVADGEVGPATWAAMRGTG